MRDIKRLLLLVLLIFFITGCTKVNDNDDYISLVNECVGKDSVSNSVGTGYSYYLARGLRLEKNYDYNVIFDYNDVKLYLYVDVISYYYKSSLKDNSQNDYYYFEKINNNNKEGYLKIEYDSSYLVTLVYNYGKIQFNVSKKEDINKLVSMAAIVLNSIKYNDNIIENIIKGNYGEYSEFTYSLKKPSDSSSKFSDYLEEYVIEDDTDTKLPDE